MFEYIFGIDKGVAIDRDRFWRDYYNKVVFLGSFFPEAMVFLIDPYYVL